MKSRSPLKDPPLRNPGQSLDAEFRRLFDDKIVDAVTLVALTVVITIVEWLEFLLKTGPSPLLWTAITAAAVVWAIWRYRRTRGRLDNLRLGRDGERAVGQFLEGLRVDGCRVFHDVPGDGFNLDHVVISTRGIFVIETKTFRKPTPQSVITVESDRVRVGGYQPDRNPIEQVRAGAKWLSQILKQSTGREFSPRGVVVFPGWFVEQRGPRGDVWVLEPKALPAFIEAEPESISAPDVSLAAYHLSRYVRSVEAELAGK